MLIRAVLEYNEKGYLAYAENFPGAFARAKTRQEVLDRLPAEAARWLRWAEGAAPAPQAAEVQVVQEQKSGLAVDQADTGILFDSEKGPLAPETYTRLRDLALRSARDFHALYCSIPDVDQSSLPVRQCFYGYVPRTAREMYRHTNEVTSSYLDGLAEVENLPDIYENRAAAFRLLEETPDYLDNAVYSNLWQEPWSLKKALRRFLWHDRIHARAMYRMASGLWGAAVADPFCFGE